MSDFYSSIFQFSNIQLSTFWALEGFRSKCKAAWMQWAPQAWAASKYQHFLQQLKLFQFSCDPMLTVHCLVTRTLYSVQCALAWVVLVQVAPHDWNRLDSWYLGNFGPLDIWARSETWPEIVLLIFLAIQGKIQGKKIVKLVWAITFYWSVLWT